ncbi:peptidoglycan-binding domain-containing protein [Streptomyces sp. YU58]|uniref:peptidoglycan-binding domain-containing protein n=1 Tax=Streptomyces sp. SX92 TaxID=3158972 RepID=UPI0027BA1411|nr:peptidoglycan-binding domain-containing protein [Streptomyces coralus]WLW50410.1 peptidoglycan-binding domain-containing protein [Streptomyces coralus]
MTIEKTVRRIGVGIATVALAGTAFAGSAHAGDLKDVQVKASAACTDRHVIFTVDGTPYHGFDYSKAMTTIISKGSQGNIVKEAQCLLEYVKCSPGTVDGIFGDKTRAATMRFQERNGLGVDGSIGPKTWPKLRDLDPKGC